MTRWRGVRDGAVVPLVTTLAVWELSARLLARPAFPPFSVVLSTLVGLAAEGRIFGDLVSSLAALGLGFSLALVVGVAAGVLMGAFAAVDDALQPYLTLGLVTPALVYVPVLFTLGGTSRWTQVATVFLYAVFAVASYTQAGMHAASRTAVEMAQAFGASRRQTLALVVWPGARPLVMSGLRVAVALAVKGMINGEMLIATTGLGALVQGYGSRFQIAELLALLMVIIGVAMAATALLGAVERRVRHEVTGS